MPITHFTPGATYPRFGSLLFPTLVPVTIATAGPVTITAAQLLGGLVLRDCNGAARSDVLPNAADLLALIPGPGVGTGFQVTIRNAAAGAFTLTLTPGTGVTISGTATIANTQTKNFLVVFTSVVPGAEACTFYSLGTATF